jgi:uncharacterized membrane protein
MVILRMIHILSGVVWAGAVIFLTVVLQPAIAGGGPEAGRFMQRLASQSRFRLVTGIAPLLTVLSGLVLYGRVSAGFQMAWITSGTGLSLTIGALATLLTFVVFGVFQRPVVARQQVLGAEVQRSGGAPTSAQAAEMQVLQRRMRGAMLWTTLLLTVAVLAMSGARYIRL